MRSSLGDHNGPHSGSLQNTDRVDSREVARGLLSCPQPIFSTPPFALGEPHSLRKWSRRKMIPKRDITTVRRREMRRWSSGRSRFETWCLKARLVMRCLALRSADDLRSHQVAWTLLNLMSRISAALRARSRWT